MLERPVRSNVRSEALILGYGSGHGKQSEAELMGVRGGGDYLLLTESRISEARSGLAPPDPLLSGRLTS